MLALLPTDHPQPVTRGRDHPARYIHPCVTRSESVTIAWLQKFSPTGMETELVAAAVYPLVTVCSFLFSHCPHWSFVLTFRGLRFVFANNRTFCSG